ncbi:hypothetical protein [Nibribacter koreensis]|uniref:Lipoprotein n=1 Tax=Nibribacter koreensis TaxID=1084519 RepID=A0ABP8FQK8_9BACT
MHKVVGLALIALSSFACTSKQGDSIGNETVEVSTIGATVDTIVVKEALRQKKALIDSLFDVEIKDTLLTPNRKQFQVWVKLPNSGELTQVVNNNWPEEVESTFNLQLDSQGRIIRIAEMPYSESGDWDIMYSHYFTEEGKTFAFEKLVSAFNTFCPNNELVDDVTREKVINLYSPSFTRIDSTYKMTDEKGKDITSKKCELQVNSETMIFKNLAAYLSANKLNLK